ncbi:MAG: rubrerythrin family protein [Treponema sp.]|jgi:VIT1/CCC1 family predicted Fe2+/Mn2+ transporter|nr:MAG: rubrerythrin family protein [Treponema sp.]HQL33111.1 VIT1/CCC1 transporter family protein [Treponemataceae bacterium]
MPETVLSPELRATFLTFQQDEVDSNAIYTTIADMLGDDPNAQIIRSIAAEEAKHAARWEALTGKKLKPSRLKVLLFTLTAKILGITFAIKRLELGESEGQEGYKAVLSDFPEIQAVIDEESAHEDALIAMIDEERLKYAGSVVLGLNDALVELTGALAGFTFAFQNTRLIAMTGLITGISAAFSMASSEYLSQRSEGDGSVSPVKSALYTGIAYILTVALLVLPFFLTTNFLLALGITLIIVVLIILGFNYYLCTAKDLPFRRHFLEMFVVSLGVTLLSFVVGVLVKKFLGVEI